MLDPKEAGRELGRQLLAMRQKQEPVEPKQEDDSDEREGIKEPVTVNVAAPIVNVPETVVNVSPAAVSIEPAQVTVAAPNVTVEAPSVNVDAPVINVSVDMSGVEKAINAMANAVAVMNGNTDKQGEGMFAVIASVKALEAAFLAPKTLVMDENGKPIGVRTNK